MLSEAEREGGVDVEALDDLDPNIPIRIIVERFAVQRLALRRQLLLLPAQSAHVGGGD